MPSSASDRPSRSPTRSGGASGTRRGTGLPPVPATNAGTATATVISVSADALPGSRWRLPTTGQAPAHMVLAAVPLAGVLVIQAALSVRLLRADTAYQGEAAALWAGHLGWAH